MTASTTLDRPASSRAEPSMPRTGARGRSLRTRRRPPHLVGLLLVPAVGLTAIAYLIPAIAIVARSMTSFVAPQVGGLDNFVWLVTDPANVTIMGRTLLVSTAVTLVIMAIAFPYAYLMTVVTPRWRAVLLAFVVVPYFTSYLVQIFAWVILLRDGGLADMALERTGLITDGLLGTPWAVGIGMVQNLLPMMILPLYSTLSTIDRTLLVAGASLGSTPSRVMRKVYLPLAVPGLITGGLLVFVFALGFYLVPAVLGSPQESLIAQQITVQVQRLLAWGRSAALAVALLLVTAIVLWIATRVSRGSISAAYGGLPRTEK